MLAQLKTVGLIKETIKLVFRLVEYLEHQHLWVWLQAQNSQKQITLFWNSSVYSSSQKWRLFNARNWQETEDLIQRYVLLPSQRKLSLTRSSTRKTPVSTSTVRRQLRDASLLGRVPLSSVCVLLPILIFYFYWPVWDMAFFFATLPRRPASRRLPLHCWRWDWYFVGTT